MTEPIHPTKKSIKQLIQFKVITPNLGFYDYAPEFVETVTKLKGTRLGRIKTTQYARKAASDLATTMLAYKSFRNRKEIDNLVTAHVCLNYHLERLSIKNPGKLDDLSYAVWYFNDHKLRVEP